MITRLYRVEVEYPPGAFDEDGNDVEPDGWEPDEYHYERWGDRFFWPSDDKIYHSRSTAAKRRNLFRRLGCRAEIQRSAPIVWEMDSLPADMAARAAGRLAPRGDSDYEFSPPIGGAE